MKGARRFPYGRLLWTMTVCEAKLRDQGTALGFLWTLLHPLLMFAVLYALFLKWMGRFVDNYPAYLLIGLVFWSVFQKTTSVALPSLRRQSALILNYRFPREIVVLSSAGAVLWSCLLELVVLLAILPWLGATPRWSWLGVVPLLAIEAAFACGAALILAVLAVEYQDMERVWDVLVTALFYMTPVFYPLAVLQPSRRELVLLSPVARLLEAARGCLIDGRWPPLSAATGLAVASALVLATGLALLRRSEPRLADRLLS
jgi:ABC-type polysaccharide/polyol phosphate export permease